MSTSDRIVKVAATQMTCSAVKESNLQNAVKLVREAASQGAQIILLQELFHGLYFCQVWVFCLSALKIVFTVESIGVFYRSKRENILDGLPP